MRLKLLHPRIANRNCQVCLKYMFDEKTGLISLGRDGKAELRLTNMGAEFLAPCLNPTKGCPKGTPENPKTLSPANEDCYEHYRECRAVGQFPDDPIVRRNAAVIREIEEDVERINQIKFQNALAEMMVL